MPTNRKIQNLKRLLAEENNLRESLGRRVVRLRDGSASSSAAGNGSEESGLVVNVRVEGLVKPQSDEEAAYYQRLSEMTRMPTKAQRERLEANQKGVS